MTGGHLTAIDGVLELPLQPNADDRGSLVELYRTAWTTGFEPVQWNLFRNRSNVLRGFHCHVHHTDLLAIVDGSMVLGLKDLRIDSLTHDRSRRLIMTPQTGLVMIPPGVGHGFYFTEPTTVLNAVSHEWSKQDELGCRWDDPDLDVDWSCSDPIISERDSSAGTLSELRSVVRDRLPAT
jgi:dTDP-4-dehydrorhamnose 3,5-epimerase